MSNSAASVCAQSVRYGATRCAILRQTSRVRSRAWRRANSLIAGMRAGMQRRGVICQRGWVYTQAMRSKAFGWTGIPVAVIGQGTWHMGESRHQRAAEVAALRAGLELGM